MTRKPPRQPLIAIIGATGTGKSQLAVSLAKRFNGEVINGDAMQLYAGLPVITNKITAEEQRGIPHHLLGCIGLEEPTWVVGTFVKKALEVIEEVRGRGRVPILVGGTHYYAQSLLFRGLLNEEDGHDDGMEAENGREDFQLSEQPTEVLLADLQKVDPVMAERWHPKDRRKIQRSLEIYIKTGRKASEVYAEQRLRKTGGTDGLASNDGEDMPVDKPGMRLPTLLFWVYAEKDALRERLDARVDKMLEAGLLDEVRTLNACAEAESAAGRPVDETRGIWVSIGYKELKDYVQALESGDTSEKDLQRLKTEALEKTKAATRQYAKRQLRWIRIKLLNSLSAANSLDNLYLLDGSDVSTFGTSVVEPAARLTNDFSAAAPMPAPSTLSPAAEEMLKPRRDYDLSAAPEKWTKSHCEVCGVTCVVKEQWRQHVGSKAHKKLVSKRRARGRVAADDVSVRGGTEDGGLVDAPTLEKG